jgi:hypothetical protein
MQVTPYNFKRIVKDECFLPLNPMECGKSHRDCVTLWTRPVPRPALSVTCPVGIHNSAAPLVDIASPRGWWAHPLDTSTLLRNYCSRCVVGQSAVCTLIRIACSVHCSLCGKSWHIHVPPPSGSWAKGSPNRDMSPMERCCCTTWGLSL